MNGNSLKISLCLKKEAIDLMEEHQRWMCKTKSTPKVIVSYHRKWGFKHLHILHDCSWTGQSCRCVITQGFHIQCCSKWPIWNTNIELKSILNITNYLLQQGRQVVYLQVGDISWTSNHRDLGGVICRCIPGTTVTMEDFYKDFVCDKELVGPSEPHGGKSTVNSSQKN